MASNVEGKDDSPVVLAELEVNAASRSSKGDRVSRTSRSRQETLPTRFPNITPAKARRIPPAPLQFHESVQENPFIEVAHLKLPFLVGSRSSESTRIRFLGNLDVSPGFREGLAKELAHQISRSFRTLHRDISRTQEKHEDELINTKPPYLLMKGNGVLLVAGFISANHDYSLEKLLLRHIEYSPEKTQSPEELSPAKSPRGSSIWAAGLVFLDLASIRCKIQVRSLLESRPTRTSGSLIFPETSLFSSLRTKVQILQRLGPYKRRMDDTCFWCLGEPTFLLSCSTCIACLIFGKARYPKLQATDHGYDVDTNSESSFEGTKWSAISESSKSSVMMGAEERVTGAEEFARVFLEDNFVRSTLQFIARSSNSMRLKSKIRSLLKHLKRRLAFEASSPVEREVVQLFRGRRQARHLTTSITTMASPGDQADAGRISLRSFPRGQMSGREKVESFLCLQDENKVDLSSEGAHYDVADYSEDSEDSNASEDEGRVILPTLDRARNFLRNSEAFARFREELGDLLHPFEKRAMWSRDCTLWDGEERVLFDHPNFIKSLTRSDRMKLGLEEKLGGRIAWWPLRPPMRLLPLNKVRVSWPCDCGEETFIDVSLSDAQQYRYLCTTKPAIIQERGTQASILPTTASVTSLNSQSNNSFPQRVFKNIRNGIRQRFLRKGSSHPTGKPRSGKASTASSQSQLSRVIHWCVDDAVFGTKLHNICIESMKGKAFVDELRRSYQRLRGWKWYLSMKSCSRIRLTKLIRVDEDEDIVRCANSQEVLPDPLVEKDYKYFLDPPSLSEEAHIERVEARLISYYLGHAKCRNEERINKVVLSVPHLVTGNPFGMEGYGIRACQGWSVLKTMAFLLITQTGPIIWAVYWLVNHPGDTNNAFTPGLYVLGLVGLFVALPDIYSD